ncbi:hypothetical protein U6A24_03560 [Aquimarina gracilis]|uniref:DoxX-like protein n=1 Tax=Aquimarina gracilis TaxID=874422 RepID=A0ABU5ZTD0_9FLAO|nr:hypothetical protein [Aquimarina gracilis]MEB3344521.1 hypothetical protein [Aquimarina gracilis]
MNLEHSVIITPKPEKVTIKKVSKFKNCAMKFVYLLTFVALGYDVWSEIINPSEVWGGYDGVVYSFWAAYAALMGLGIRYPLKMLPLLLLQLFYKSVWLLGIYLPLSMQGQLDTASEGFLMPFAIAIPLDLIAIPWRYVYRNYIQKLFRFS